jgi:hypothetical protein
MIVFDHVAFVGENIQLQPAIEQCPQRLLDSGKAFLTLSGPYLLAAIKPHRSDLRTPLTVSSASIQSVCCGGRVGRTERKPTSQTTPP